MLLLVWVLVGWDSAGIDHAAWFGRVQVIHNAPDTGDIDLYIDGKRIWDNARFQTATPYMPVAHGKHTIEIVAGSDPNNDNPIYTQTVTVRRGVNYVVVALGLVRPFPGDPAFELVVQNTARLATTSVNALEYFLVHGATCLDKIDVRVLDPVRNNEVAGLLVNNLGFGEASTYLSLGAGGGHNIEIVTADGATQLAVFRLASPAPSGETFMLTLSCMDASYIEGVTMMGVEVDGSVFLPPVITANEQGETAGLPETFALQSNYPNPFNPRTTIQFDLAQPAEISVEIVDMLGRRVMTVPARQMEAGAGRTVEVEAATLASGAYLYHVIARTATETRVETGRMVLVK